MSIQAVAIAISAILAMASIVSSSVFFLAKKALFEKLDKLENKMEKISAMVIDNRLYLNDNYAKKKEIPSCADAHSKLWQEVNSLRERTAVVETKEIKNG